MDKKAIEKTLEEAKKNSKKRNFEQTIELIINLKELDLKIPEHQVEFFTTLPYPQKKNVICAIVGPELADQAKQHADKVITPDKFPIYIQDKKAVKKLAQECDFFIAQANIMTEIAKVFGRVLGPRGKMPNPKAGGVVPANANIKLTIDKLKITYKISAKLQPTVKIALGKENTDVKQIVENAHTIYTQVVQKLPNEEQNIKNALIKLTMGKPVKIIADKK